MKVEECTINLPLTVRTPCLETILHCAMGPWNFFLEPLPAAEDFNEKESPGEASQSAIKLDQVRALLRRTLQLYTEQGLSITKTPSR